MDQGYGKCSGFRLSMAHAPGRTVGIFAGARADGKPAIAPLSLPKLRRHRVAGQVAIPMIARACFSSKPASRSSSAAARVSKVDAAMSSFLFQSDSTSTVGSRARGLRPRSRWHACGPSMALALPRRRGRCSGRLGRLPTAFSGASRRQPASEHQYLGPYRAFVHECCRYPFSGFDRRERAMETAPALCRMLRLRAQG